MKTLLSPGATVRKITDTARRFPLAVASLVAGSVLVLFVVHGFEDAIDYRWGVALAVAFSAGIAAPLAFEDRSCVAGQFTGLALAALWGVRCLFFPADSHDVTIPQGVETGVVAASAFLSIFFASFLRRDTDVRWWNFSARTLVRLALGAAFSTILFGGFLLAIYATTELFDADPPEELFGWLAVVCFMLFAPLYVMAGIPRGESKYDPEPHPFHLLKVFSLYILGPILAAYALILYAYLLKIVFTWQLPDGRVAWLVTALAVGGLVVSLLLWPLRVRGGDRVADFLGRWTGVVIAPLLVLMTVGIARRISDYGLTPNRCYILLLNLWFYGVYAWLFVVKGRRVKWILVSAVVVALLSSVGPWSLAKIPPRPGTTDTVETPEAQPDSNPGTTGMSR